MNETLKSILESLEQAASTAIQKYKSKEDMSFIDLAIKQLIVTNDLMKDQHDESAKEFKASVSGMLAALNDTKNCDRAQLVSMIDEIACDDVLCEDGPDGCETCRVYES